LQITEKKGTGNKKIGIRKIAEIIDFKAISLFLIPFSSFLILILCMNLIPHKMKTLNAFSINKKL